MAQYDTTATCQEDVVLREASPNTNFNGSNLDIISATNDERSIFSFKPPPKPVGADSLDRITLVTTYKAQNVDNSNRTWNVYEIVQNWTESSATWNRYNGTGNLWTLAGGDRGTFITAIKAGSPSYGSSFSFDISTLGVDWSKNYDVLIKDANEGNATIVGKRIFDTESVATVAWMPHIVVTFSDNPPDAITDLTISPDVSLSEASYTFRQRAVLKWTASNANDFGRYRIRVGVNRSDSANHIHKAFISSRGSTTYLDETIYPESATGGSTI